MTEKTVWAIHSGRLGEADPVFLDQSKIALGWSEMGDLRQLSPDRESFKKKVIETYPDRKPGAWPVWAGLLYRFVHEAKIGDFVIWPSKVDPQIYIGAITGEYQYQTENARGYVHQRAISWGKPIARVRFTQDALYEIGGAMAFFQVKNYAGEFLRAMGKGPVNPLPPDTGGPDADAMEELTRVFILKTLSTQLKGFPLEGFIAHLLEKMGYVARISQHGGDEGIDIVAHKDELGFEPPIIKVQVKSGNDVIKQDEVAALLGRLAGSNEVGLFITLSSFNANAKSFARGKDKLRLINGDELVQLILEHYDEFEARYKVILPLRRVFMPDLVKEE